MKNPIFNLSANGSVTVKVIENLKNKSGKYSTKNEGLVEIAKKCLSLKGLGCNFCIGVEYDKEGYYVASNSEFFTSHDVKKTFKLNEVVNFITCLSLTMSDRCFVVSLNDKNQIMVTCLSMSKFPTKILVREKNSVVTETLTVKNAFDTSVSEDITLKSSKGVRVLNDTDISNLKTAFNSMLNLNYNKPLVEKVEKNA